MEVLKRLVWNVSNQFRWWYLWCLLRLTVVFFHHFPKINYIFKLVKNYFKHCIPLGMEYLRCSFFSRFFKGSFTPKISENRKTTIPSSIHKTGSGAPLLSSNSSCGTAGPSYKCASTSIM